MLDKMYSFRYDDAERSVVVMVSMIGDTANVIAYGTDCQLRFRHQLSNLEDSLDECICRLPSGFSPVWMRYFLSDIANQHEGVGRNRNCGVSLIGQPPLSGAKVAVWMHLAKDAVVDKLADDFWRVTYGGTDYYWFSNRSFFNIGSLPETERLFSRYSALLAEVGIPVADHCMRTWFFVRDIDENYHGLVVGRNAFFNDIGLTRDTHFIASTGIGGRPVGGKVTMDAYAIGNMDDVKVKYLKASDFLNDTADYGVAFERATCVESKGWRNVIVSGTASIDNKGRIVFPGDVEAQFGRMVTNVKALLHEGGCRLSDVGHIIIYLRDPADYTKVHRLAVDTFDTIPYVIVNAPVCRPGWLIEMECSAIAKQ